MNPTLTSHLPEPDAATSIAFESSVYRADFLAAADPVRFYREAIPAEGASRCDHPWPANRLEDIERGYKYRNVYDKRLKQTVLRRCPLIRLDRETRRGVWTPLRANIARIERQLKDHEPRWILTTYADDSTMNVTYFDLDRHFTFVDRVDQVVENSFWCRVERLQESALAPYLRWVTSPGDYFRGQLVQGLHAYLRTDHQMTSQEWRMMMQQLLFVLKFDAEHFYDKAHRPIRLPGQHRCDAVAVDPNSRRFLRLTRNFADFVEWWEDGPTMPFEELQALGHAGKRPRGEGCTRQPTGELCGLAARQAVDIAELLSESNTFSRATKARICSSLARKYGGSPEHLNEAVEEAKGWLIAISPTDSRTCLDPHRLHQTVSTWMLHYFETYDARLVGCSTQDFERFSYCRGLTRTAFVAALPEDLSDSERDIVWSFYELCSKFRGRVASQLIYRGKGALCSHTVWFGRRGRLGLKQKLEASDVLATLSEYEPNWKQREGRSVGRCRQYGFGKHFVQRAKALEGAGACEISSGASLRVAGEKSAPGEHE